MKIAIYGIGKVAESFCKCVENINEEIDIVYFIQTEKKVEYFHGKKVIAMEEIDFSEFDKLVIATNVYYEEIITHIRNVNENYDLYKDKIIKYSELFLPKWEEARRIMPYCSCRVYKEIVYITTSEDESIAKPMFTSGRNLSEDLINVFFELTKLKYNQDIALQRGYFLDIGANIGTTSIYVKKRINPDLHIIGFEPGKSNYDLFRVNCILNQTEDIKVEPFGLSNINTKRKYRYNVTNSGGSGIVGDTEEGENISTIEVMRLDDYLTEHGISPNSIDYIWMDTEGHENEILEGAMETLSAKKIPLLHEFNPVTYSRKNALEKYIEDIQRIYSFFLDVHEYIAGKENVIPIERICDKASEMIKNGKEQTDLFFF